MNVTGKQHPELIERPACLLVPTSTKSGIALLYNEETNNTYDVCLKLTKEVLTIQKLDVVCTSGSESQVNNCCTAETSDWRSRLKHQRRCRAQRACGYIKDFQRSTDQSGKLFVGDAVLQVHLLRTAGDEVTITVRYLREVPSFLKLPLGSPGLSTDHSRVSSPLFDSGLHLNGNGNNTAPSPPSPSANEPKYEKRWLDAVSLPLLMARVSRYKAGTDKLRSNCFEVFAVDGVSTNILQFCTAAESTDWLQAISTNINDLTQENIKIINKYCASDDQIVYMGWACESSEGSSAGRTASFKFLALRGPYFYIFRSPPISAADWGQAETTYNLYEVLFKVHKLWMAEDCWLQARLYLGLEHSPEQQDNESLCFSILVGHGQSHTFRVELATDLAIWEKSFQRAVFLEVQRIRSKSYMCSSQGNVLCFTIDFGLGFICSEGTSKTILWRYKFSQLKGSSDDGKTRVKLLFKNAESKQIEMKELEFANLTAVLHCIHSFIAAKVASMDPLFMCSQSFPGNYMNS
ncbi:gamma-2-syntrophin isoform X4 [Trachinotus anak]|uniref:gamma-2-syntrophin isoform X4 n=1 Tax=Trachinotus anak TaxID=443729 RepID=UPI0039F18A29